MAQKIIMPKQGLQMTEGTINSRKTPRFNPANICLSIPANMPPAMPNIR